jgi:iron-sulfur cluster assembly protein
MTISDAPAQPAVTMTEEAIRQAKRLLERQSEAGAFLRIGLRGGGCSGFSYVLKTDTRVTGRDEVFDFDGLKVVIDRKSLRYLGGTVVEYTGNLMMAGGFEFRNPNAAKSCGCGISFTVKEG